MKKIAALSLFSLFSCCVFADVTMPKIFGDNMVLQRNKSISIWGWATAGEKVTVQFSKQQKTVVTDPSGKWQLLLQPENAGGPYQLLVKGNNTISLENVLVGEVWICSGQSNMEMPIAGWGKIKDYEKEIANADYPLIRHFKVPNTVSATLKEDITGGEWKICNPTTAGEFSATAYFFARALYEKLKVPIGLINTSWGGTQSEAWTSQAAFEQSSEFKKIADEMKTGKMEETAKKRTEIVLANIKKAQGSLDEKANTAGWKNTNFDDSKWPAMKLPGVWEDNGFPGLDGIVWFRKTINIAEADAGKPAMLELAKVDDVDETYINGEKIGGMDKWDELRKYTIAPGILKASKNVIAVKVTDHQGGGGIYGDANTLQLTVGNTVLPLSGEWQFRIESMTNNSANGTVGPNDFPSLLFNAMINPLLSYSIRGAIWYQGEANAGRAYQYRTAFPLMIKDWRQHFKQGNFPFLFVQLSTFGTATANSNNGSNWAELREAQAMSLSLPHTGMAVTTDIGNPADIHPKNKQGVGKRLAAIALHDVYGQAGEYTGPVYKSMKISGDTIEISFDHTGTGLLLMLQKGFHHNEDYNANGFEVAAADKKFHPAKAMIKENKVIVFSEDVKHPVAVRYNWADDASAGNLFNAELFPAAPFRTDNWVGVTVKNKYSIAQ
jgi:sialate O-acetylesterase